MSRPLAEEIELPDGLFSCFGRKETGFGSF
jgi:hypothetical protein